MARSQSTRKQSLDAAQLLLIELKEIYSAESQLARAAPRLAKKVESETLKKMLETRLEQGERILGELDTAFETLNTSPGRKKNVAAEGLIADAQEHAQEIEAGAALDAVLLGAVQKLELYCIAAWGVAKTLAESTEQSQVVKAMEQVLQEGKAFDKEMTKLAQSEINPALLAMSQMEEGEDDEEETPPRSRKTGSKEQRAAH